VRLRVLRQLQGDEVNAPRILGERFERDGRENAEVLRDENGRPQGADLVVLGGPLPFCRSLIV
jgi:hypothetical protein